MKTVGLALLFGLCCLTGFRIAAVKTERLRTVRALQGDLQHFSERIASGRGSLIGIASEQPDLFCGALSRYLDALAQGKTEDGAMETAVEGLRSGSTEYNGMQMFFAGLSAAGRTDLVKRTEMLGSILKRAETESESETKQARVIRVSGALVGAAIAILLI